MQLEKLTPHLGTIIHGVDLSEAPGDSIADDLRGLLAERGVLFFREQDLSASSHLRLSQIFGEVVKSPHPKFGCVDNIPEVARIVNDKDNPPDINVWHSDLTYFEKPATVCVLHAREIPEQGGDTLWSSMTRAYANLSKPMKEFLAPLKAYHQLPLDGWPPDMVKQALEGPIAAIHPVIREIPETGAKSLFVNRVYTHRIEGLTRAESVRRFVSIICPR